MSQWNEPRLLRYTDLQRYLWGDEQSGLVCEPETSLTSVPVGG